MKDYLTIDEVAGRYRVSKQTVRRWAAAGVIAPPVRLGRRLIRWRAADLAEREAMQPAAPKPQPV